MIAIDDALAPSYRKDVDQASRYLSAVGVDEAQYCIVPISDHCPASARLALRYDTSALADRGTVALLDLPFEDRTHTLRAGFPDAIMLLIFFLEDPSRLQALSTISAGLADEDMLNRLGIDPDRTCRSGVGAWSEGSFLAPQDEGYAYFVVEQRGAIEILGWSAVLAPVAAQIAADRAIEETDLASKIAKIAPYR